MMPKQFSLLTLAVFSFVSAITVFSAQRSAPIKVNQTLSITDLGGWQPARKGIETRKIALERVDPSSMLELKLLRLDARMITARVLRSTQLGAPVATAQWFVERSGALAAINGNYFDENGRPLAYLKTAEQEINRTVSKHALYTGVFAIRDGLPVVMHRDDFQPALASEALQSGPLLLLRGAPVEVMPGLGRYARRALIGIDKSGRVIIAATDAIAGGLSFAEAQELFSNPKWQIDTPDLLNLDGGGSAQLYFKAGKFEESVLGTSDVPVAIGFFPTK